MMYYVCTCKVLLVCVALELTRIMETISFTNAI